MPLIPRILRFGQWFLFLSTLMEESLSSPAQFQGYPIKCFSDDNVAHDHSLSKYLQKFQGSYTLTVEMTAMAENVTYYVKEVRHKDTSHGSTANNGTLYFRRDGMEKAIYYYPKTNTILEDIDGNCKKSSLNDVPAKFWGWHHDGQSFEDQSIGPTTILKRLFSSIKVQRLQDGDQNTNGTKYEIWESCEDNGRVLFRFYFPLSLFSNGFHRMLPFRFEVILMDGSESFQYEVLSYLPHAEIPRITEASQLSACAGMAKHFALPRLPEQFSYWQEIVETSHFKDRTEQRRLLQMMKVTHSQIFGLTRLDFIPKYILESPYGTNSQLSVIRDILAGTEFIINKDFGNCSKIEFSKSSVNYPYDTTHLLVLDDSFIFMGIRNTRNIDCELWASTQMGIPNPDTDGFESYPKVKLELCLAKRKYQTPEGIEEIDTPISSALLIYDLSDPRKLLKKFTTNIYNFKPIKGFPEEDFSVKECLLRRAPNRRGKLKVSSNNDEVDPEHRFTTGDMVGVACSMIILGIMMTASYLVIIVLTGQRNFPDERPPSDLVRMSYVNLKSKSAQGESES